MNATKLKSFLITVCCLFLALFSNSQSMEYNREHIERGQGIVRNLEKDWNVSRNATIAVSGVLAQISLGIGEIQGLEENDKKTMQSIFGAVAAIPFLAHANIASQNMENHGNWSVFSNIEAKLEPLFYQNIGERYQNKDEFIFETLKQVSFLRESDDNAVRILIPFSWFIPEFRVKLNTKLEAVYKNIRENT